MWLLVKKNTRKIPLKGNNKRGKSRGILRISKSNDGGNVKKGKISRYTMLEDNNKEKLVEVAK